MADDLPQKLCILIVDDDASIRELLEWMLQEAGHTVHLAGDGLQALAFLTIHGPVDVVLSDINMPCMDGMELRREMRVRWPDLPILLTSGRPPPAAIHHFLPKPFRWETLTTAIMGLLGPAAELGHRA